MSFFAVSPFLTALGWALLNSLWQFAICWLIYRSFSAGIKKLSAPARHTLALLVLFAGTLSFIAGLSWKYYANAAAMPFHNHAIPVSGTYYYTIWHTADSTLNSIMPYWSLLYLLCIVFLFLKFCLFVQRAGSLQNNGVSKMTGAWRMYVNNIAAQLGIQREVKALLSAHIDTPQVIGFLKPVILLPAACLVNLSTEQLEAVLLHELVHIKRNDYIVNIFVTSTEILFFFNPFVKDLAAAIRKEREYSCDDMVIQFQYQPHNYATALLTLEKSRLLPVTYGIAAGGKNQQQLLTRIERIMGIENRKIGFYRMGACLMALLLLGFIASINPAKVAADNFGEVNLALAFTDNNFTSQPYNNEAGSSFQNIALAPVQKSNAVLAALKPAPAIAKIEKTSSDALLYELVSSVETDDGNNGIQSAARKEKIEFSLSQKEKPVIPDADDADDPAIAEPYVPASSFSFQLTQDTALPKLKSLTYNERMAKDAMLKAQKALEQLNWQKIEKELKYHRKDLAKLKNEIVVQLQKMNWQKINSEVKEQLSQEQMEKVSEAIQQDQTLKQYQQMEAYSEAMTRQLAAQQQLGQEAAQRAERARKAAEQQQKKTELELKKRRIIYI